MQHDEPCAMVLALAVNIKAGACRGDEIYALIGSDEIVFVVVTEKRRDDVAGLLHGGKLPGGNVRRAGRFAEMSGGKTVPHFIIVTRPARKALENAVRLLLRSRDLRQKIVDLRHDDVLEEIRGEESAVLRLQLVRRGLVPVDLILLDAGVFGYAFLAVGPAVEKPEIAHRAAAVGGPHKQIVVSAAGDVLSGDHKTAGVALIYGKLRLLADAALVVVVAEHGGERNAALDDGCENGIQRFFHRRFGAHGGTVYLITGKHHKIGVGSVQFRVQQAERRLMRVGGVLRVGNDENAELAVFIKLQPGRLLGGACRSAGE